MSKPTPRPWRDAGEDGIGGIEFIRIEAGEAFGASCRLVAWVMSNGGPDYNHLSAEDRANAAHLIKCVNMHEELVTALNGALVALTLGEHVDSKAAFDYGMDVIAKAEGRDV